MSDRECVIPFLLDMNHEEETIEESFFSFFSEIRDGQRQSNSHSSNAVWAAEKPLRI